MLLYRTSHLADDSARAGIKTIKYVQQLGSKLLEEQRNQTKTTPQLSIVKRTYTTDEKSKIIAKLQSLTGKKDWLSYKTNGLTVLLNLENRDEALALTKALQETKAVQAKLMRNPQTGAHVVKIDNIHPHHLQAVSSLSLVVESIEEKKLLIPRDL